jgi:hypothetical protein
MKLSDQCCTVIQAKKLKELGVSQTSVACYIGDELHLFEKGFYNWAEQKGMDAVAAYTVAEMGEMLPPGYDTMRSTEGYKQQRWLGYDLNGRDFPKESFDTEAECRAAIIIALLEEHLITPAEINARLANS